MQDFKEGAHRRPALIHDGEVELQGSVQGAEDGNILGARNIRPNAVVNDVGYGGFQLLKGNVRGVDPAERNANVRR